MSQSGRYSSSGSGPGTGIETISGDIGEVSGTSVSFNALNIAGYTWSFTGGGTTMLLNCTDVNNNIITGKGSGNAGFSGSNNAIYGSATATSISTGSGLVLVGTVAGATLTSASDCVGIGHYALGFGAATPTHSIGIGSDALFSCNGSYNVAIGDSAGSAYTGSESSNILLNNTGTLAESHTLRIGSGTGTGNGQLSAAYISGIAGVNVGSVATVVTESGDKLGTAVLTPGANITITPGANTITIAASSGSSGITTIDGDSGSVTGSTVTITESESSSAKFAGSSTTLTLTLTSTDGNFNTMLGSRTGFSTTTGSSNTCLGDFSLHDLTSGSRNVAIGQSALEGLTSGIDNTAIGDQAGGGSMNTGSYNTLIGYNAGANYTGSESSNIIIGASNSGSGTVNESNALRIGNGTGTGNYNLNSVFIAGINGVTVSTADQLMVINSSDQIGSIAHGTTGKTLISAGAGANPVWGTLGVVGGGTGDTSFTAYAVICGGTTSAGALQNVASLGTSGQVLTSQGAGALPTWTTVGGSSFTWSVITANQTAVSNNGYICNGAGTVAIALPSVSSVGDIIEVTGINNATGWSITQAASQQIFFGAANTTAGTGGSLASSATRDSVRMVCIIANTTWQVVSCIGNITHV